MYVLSLYLFENLTHYKFACQAEIAFSCVLIDCFTHATWNVCPYKTTESDHDVLFMFTHASWVILTGLNWTVKSPVHSSPVKWSVIQWLVTRMHICGVVTSWLYGMHEYVVINWQHSLALKALAQPTNERNYCL